MWPRCEKISLWREMTGSEWVISISMSVCFYLLIVIIIIFSSYLCPIHHKKYMGLVCPCTKVCIRKSRYWDFIHCSWFLLYSGFTSQAFSIVGYIPWRLRDLWWTFFHFDGSFLKSFWFWKLNLPCSFKLFVN